MAYLRRFLLTLFASLGGVAALNALIDPYDLLGTPIITGVNQVKAPVPDQFFKPLQVSVRQPHTVLIGTSRVMVGLDPGDVPGDDTYNLGVPAARMPEQIALGRHAIAAAPVERIVIGLDYLSFDGPVDTPPSFRIAVLGRFAVWRALPDILISERALLRSRDALRLSRRRATPTYTSNGRRRLPDLPTEPPAETARILRDVGTYASAYRQTIAPEAVLGRFDEFLAELQARRIAAYVFITPAHAALLETLDARGKRAAYDAWLGRIAEICAARGAALWDFGGYNRITTVPMADAAAFYFDGSHFRPAVGRLILDTLLRGDASPGFGVRLTPATLPAYLAEQRAARAAWHGREGGDLLRITQAALAAGG
jgi:hypothetical protein